MGTFYSQDFHSILLSQLPAHGAGLDIVSGYVSSDAIYWGLTMQGCCVLPIKNR